MRQRCLNPNYNAFNHYGGRGISVCPAWAEFGCFLADMGERPEGMTLDRIDVNGNYEPRNCRWATMSEQNRNRRDNYRVRYRGEVHSLATLADELGVERMTLRGRVERGWPEDRWADAPDKNRYVMPRSDKGRSRKAGVTS